MSLANSFNHAQMHGSYGRPLVDMVDLLSHQFLYWVAVKCFEARQSLQARELQNHFVAPRPVTVHRTISNIVTARLRDLTGFAHCVEGREIL